MRGFPSCCRTRRSMSPTTNARLTEKAEAEGIAPTVGD